MKKEAGEPQPWTDDEILGTYRFCNVRRMDDKVSKWLLDNWYTKYFDHKLILVNVALARFLNLPSTLGHIGFQRSWDPIRLCDKLRVYRSSTIPNRVLFNGAYMVRGNNGIDKVDSVVNYYVDPLLQLSKSIDRSSMENTHLILQGSFGLGSFMAGQIVADLRWAMKGTWKDRMTWAPIGPGSAKGMNLIHSRPASQPINQSKFLEELQELFTDLKEQIPITIMDRLELHDVQNCCCEISKYEKALWSEGRPKQLYRSQT